MDITDFINSRDIREYHREIGYEYDSLEEAFHCYKKFRVRLKAGYCFNFK